VTTAQFIATSGSRQRPCSSPVFFDCGFFQAGRSPSEPVGSTILRSTWRPATFFQESSRASPEIRDGGRGSWMWSRPSKGADRRRNAGRRRRDGARARVPPDIRRDGGRARHDETPDHGSRHIKVRSRSRSCEGAHRHSSEAPPVLQALDVDYVRRVPRCLPPPRGRGSPNIRHWLRTSVPSCGASEPGRGASSLAEAPR